MKLTLMRDEFNVSKTPTYFIFLRRCKIPMYYLDKYHGIPICLVKTKSDICIFTRKKYASFLRLSFIILSIKNKYLLYKNSKLNLIDFVSLGYYSWFK